MLLALAVVLVILVWIAAPLASFYHQSRGGALLQRSAGDLPNWPLCNPLSGEPENRQGLHQAADHFEQALAYRPQNDYALLALGRARCVLGQTQAAVSAYQRYQDLHPKNPLASLEFAFALEAFCESRPDGDYLLASPLDRVQRCKHGEMVAEINAALQAAGVSSADLISQGREAQSQEQFDEALGWYARALLLKPDSLLPLEWARQVYHLQGDLDREVQTLQLLLERSPATGDHLYRLAGFFRLADQAEKSLDVYNQALQVPESGDIGRSNILFQIGQLLQDSEVLRDPDAALQAYDQALELDDFQVNAWERAEIHYRKALIYQNRGSQAEAEAAFRQAVEQNKNHYWARIGLARLLFADGTDPEIEQLVLQAIDLRPEIIVGYRVLGNYYLQTQQLELAREAFRQALEIAPDDEAARKALDQLAP